MATLTGSAGNAPQRFASLSGIRRSGSGFEMEVCSERILHAMIAAIGRDASMHPPTAFFPRPRKPNSRTSRLNTQCAGQRPVGC